MMLPRKPFLHIQSHDETKKQTKPKKTNTAGRCRNEMRPGDCGLLSERLPVAKVEGFRPVDGLI